MTANPHVVHEITVVLFDGVNPCPGLLQELALPTLGGTLQLLVQSNTLMYCKWLLFYIVNCLYLKDFVY